MVDSGALVAVEQLIATLAAAARAALAPAPVAAPADEVLAALVEVLVDRPA